MNYIKYFKGALYFFTSLLIILLLTTVLDYFSLLKTDIINWIELILVSLSIFVTAFNIGKKSANKGYIEGIKYGLLILIFFLLIRLLLIKDSFSIKNLIYYFILLSISVSGSVLGINKKVRN